MATICSELTSDCHNDHFTAAPYEYAALAGRGEDETVLAVIDINICCHVENEIEAIFAVVNIELLTLQRINWLYLELF